MSKSYHIINRTNQAWHAKLLKVSLDQFIWDFEQGPYGASRSHFIESTEGIVGCTSFRPIDIKLGEVVYPASLNHGTKILPGYPLQEFLKETKYYEWTYQVVVSLAKPEGLRASYAKSGWLYIGDAVLLSKSNCIDKGFSCLAVPELDQEVDKFGLEVAKEFSFTLIKGSALLNWRTRGPQRYVNYLLRPRELRGYMIMTYYGYDAHIADFKAESPSDLEEMLMTAESFAARKRSLKVWSNFKDPFQEVFLKYGFEKTEITTSLYLRLNEESPNISLATNILKGSWMISGVDLGMM